MSQTAVQTYLDAIAAATAIIINEAVATKKYDPQATVGDYLSDMAAVLRQESDRLTLSDLRKTIINTNSTGS